MNEMNEPQFEFGKVIGRSKLAMPNGNFEKLVMARVREESELRKSRQNVWYSALFFVLFVVMGFVVSTQFTGYLPAVAGLSPQILKLLLQIGFVICVLHRVDYFVKYFSNRKLNIS